MICMGGIPGVDLYGVDWELRIMAKHRPLVEQLRRTISEDGRSLYAIAKASGLHIGPIQRFVAREHGMTCDSADRLCAALGVEIRLMKRRL